MESKSLYFISPGVLEVREDAVPDPGHNQVMVRTQFSAISAGTEMLLYRGQFPDNLPLDENIPSLSGAVKYPLKYGYAVIGEIMQVGSGVEANWIGKKVFAFHPHSSHFIAEINELMPVPEELSLEDALFFPNMETAVSFILDGAPRIGERVVVMGQGIVGLLTTALLEKFPLCSLVTFDHYEMRRKFSVDLGADQSLDTKNFKDLAQNPEFTTNLIHMADIVYELTGNPDGINLAIETAGYEGRIVIGSWYGKKKAEIDLGGWFHRGRLRLVSSQVSQIDSSLSSRWDKKRRYDLTWEMLKLVKPSQLVSHKFAFNEAGKAFKLLDENPENALQVILRY